MFSKIATASFYCIFMTAIVSLGLQNPVGTYLKSTIGQVPFLDKSLHLLGLLILAFFTNLTFRQKRVNIRGTYLLLGSLLIFIGITLEELSQLFIASRNFEILDMLCNYAGVYSGSVLGLIIFPGTDNQTTYADNFRKAFQIQKVFHRTRQVHDEGRDGWRTARSMGRREPR